jgi:hypothetical protein
MSPVTNRLRAYFFYQAVHTIGSTPDYIPTAIDLESFIDNWLKGVISLNNE